MKSYSQSLDNYQKFYNKMMPIIKLQQIFINYNNNTKKGNSMSSTEQKQWLAQQNLLPIYLIEDKIQANFKKINHFMFESNEKNAKINKDIVVLRDDQNTIKNNFKLKMEQMEKKIINEISMELQGRIAIAIGKSIDSFTEKIQQREKNMGDIKTQFQNKLKKMKQELKYQITMDNQKHFLKQSKKLQQALRKAPKVSHLQKSPSPMSSSSNPTPDQQGQSGGKWQQQHHLILALQQRIKSLQQFSVNVDKRMYNSITSIKDSWKQLGGELLQNKKNMIKKFDELRIDFIKLKGLKQFSIGPDKIEDQFKRKLAQKFTDIYQLLSITLTKNQYESSYQKITSKISRHDDQFIEMRKQLATNNQYFTFYANNANQDDLKKDIEELIVSINEDKEKNYQQFKAVKDRITGNYQSIGEIQRDVRTMQEEFQAKVRLIDSMNVLVNGVKDRIQNLQDFNRFGPDKLQKIHNALDIDFTATQRQLIENKNKKQGLVNVQQAQRELRIQMTKMKDEMFLLSSQNQVKDQELLQMKKSYKQLQQRMLKLKGESQQAMASRKPWVCLSCDRQEKQKQQIKKQAKIRKPQPFKGFPQQRSEKNLKPPTTPPFEQRFEVYDKFREKYLSDTIKLPEIFKQKLKDKETNSIQN